MRVSAVMRAAARAVAALVAFAVVAYLVLVAVNWNDQPPSADTERLLSMKHERPEVADAANGYVHVLGLAAAPDADPVALGAERNAYLESFVAAPSGGVALELPGVEVDYRAARSPEVAALVEACAETSACLDALRAHPDVLARWMASEQWLLDRYRRMLATDRWREAMPGDIGAPMVGYGHATEVQKLFLLAVRRHALAGDPEAVRDLLQRDLVFWRRALASSDLILSKMVAVAAIKRHFALGNLALRELPPGLAATAVPPSWREPLTVAERSLARPLANEWHYASEVLRTSMSEDKGGGDSLQRLGDRALRPFYQPQATLNLGAARMAGLGALSELPYPEMGAALARLVLPDDDTPIRLRSYNPIGNVIDSVAAGSASSYADYIARASDLEGLRRAALLVATLRVAGIQQQDAEGAVDDAVLRNPYDGAAFEWDTGDGVLVFRGREQGERGRHTLVL